MLAARAGPDMAAGVAYFTQSLETGLAPETLALRGLIACAPRDRGGGGRGLAHPAPSGLSSLTASRRAGEEQPLPGVGEVVAELPG